jgi:CTP synthase
VNDCKYIFITGGVISGLGKGVASASIGALLQARGYRVNILKLDPYLNVDPGTMNPHEHGEVFVTADGTETDLDIGYYERFLNQELSEDNNLTTGQIYHEVLSKERRGEYLGKTVQVIPHITDSIKERIHKVSKDKDILIIEIGGTIGDIEGMPFIEVIRQMKCEYPEDVMSIHLTYVPYIKTSEELKTKPTQNSVKILMGYGVRPDILLCRTVKKLPKDIKKKVSKMCGMDENNIFSARDVKQIYSIPLMYNREQLDYRIVKLLGIQEIKDLWEGGDNGADLKSWHELLANINKSKKKVNIAIVGKYVGLKDSYKSLIEALNHAGWFYQRRINIKWVDSECIEHHGINGKFKDVSGILIPGGFGTRGVEGKIKAAKYARENDIPFLGICLGMQIMIIEYARNVANCHLANSTEFNPNTNYPVVSLLEEQEQGIDMGGTLRLGNYDCKLLDDTVEYWYGEEDIVERHRHRYEVDHTYILGNDDSKEYFVNGGLVISGINEDKYLVEILRNINNGFSFGVQFHPEFRSRPMKPHPIFKSFIKSCMEN